MPIQMWYRQKEPMNPAPATKDPLLGNAAPPQPQLLPLQPLVVTITPTHPTHWLTALQMIQAVMAAEQPLLLQVLPTKAAIGTVAGGVGLDAILAVLSARFIP